MTAKFLKTVGTAALAALVSSATVFAGPITDRIAAGESIRIGFSNIPNFGFPDDAGKAAGFMNDIAIGTLKSMGHDNIEPVVTDWGGLIPGLQAGRYDMITGGLYVTNARCENISFSAPVGNFSDAFLVPAGNPKGINNYEDILSSGSILVTGAGYNTVEAAKGVGITDEALMQVPGPTEMLASMKAGRADAAVLTYFEAAHLAEASEGALELGDLSKMPEWTKNWAAIGIRNDDAEFLAAFNTALSAYLGSEEMLSAVAAHGYTKDHLPGEVTTEWVCANR